MVVLISSNNHKRAQVFTQSLSNVFKQTRTALMLQVERLREHLQSGQGIGRGGRSDFLFALSVERPEP